MMPNLKNTSFFILLCQKFVPKTPFFGIFLHAICLHKTIIKKLFFIFSVTFLNFPYYILLGVDPKISNMTKEIKGDNIDSQIHIGQKTRLINT